MQCIKKRVHFVRREEAQVESTTHGDDAQRNDADADSGIRLSIIIIEGPSRWIAKNALYCRIISPKLKFLHPFYILNDFKGSLDQLVMILYACCQVIVLPTALKMMLNRLFSSS